MVHEQDPAQLFEPGEYARLGNLARQPVPGAREAAHAELARQYDVYASDVVAAQTEMRRKGPFVRVGALVVGLGISVGASETDSPVTDTIFCTLIGLGLVGLVSWHIGKSRQVVSARRRVQAIRTLMDEAGIS